MDTIPQGPNQHPPPAAILVESEDEVEVRPREHKSGKTKNLTYAKVKVSAQHT